ncbi:MAG: GNAT family N-acetyltransferase [Candidatus Omnitrophica bacterium]|nr:GNAT family N-acetyltransferase [Candidatus Omnitrophota bacterium]
MISIRKFQTADKEEVRKISCATALLETHHGVFFDDDEILADALTLYFTDYEPESCFVAVEDEEVVGYLIGTFDFAEMNKIFSKKILPGILWKTLYKGTFLKKKHFIFAFNVLKSFLKGEFTSPDFTKQYPAILHINIKKNSRGQNAGKELIENYLALLKSKNISGVHCGTMSERAKTFFTQCGFKVLFEGKRSYLRYCLNKDIPYYICGKLL